MRICLPAQLNATFFHSSTFDLHVVSDTLVLLINLGIVNIVIVAIINNICIVNTRVVETNQINGYPHLKRLAYHACLIVTHGRYAQFTPTWRVCTKHIV